MKHLVVCLLFCSGVSLATESRLESCLPPGITLSDVVSRGLTVADRLLQLNARCEGNTLLEPGGKEIRLYRLLGCWGNPPSGAQGILDRQRTELEELSRRYTVIEMTCYADGDPRRIP